MLKQLKTLENALTPANPCYNRHSFLPIAKHQALHNSLAHSSPELHLCKMRAKCVCVRERETCLLACFLVGFSVHFNSEPRAQEAILPTITPIKG